MKTTITYLRLLMCLFITGAFYGQQNEYLVLIDFAGSGSCFSESCPNGPAGITYETITTTGTVSYPFTDPLVGGDIPRTITVNYFGDCNADMEISINSEVIGTGSVASSCECFCGESGNSFTVNSAEFASGIPGYVYGGQNFLNINYTSIGPSGIVRNFYAEIVINDPTLSVPDSEENENAFQIIPNPSTDNFRIVNLKGDAAITLFDAMGKKIKELHVQGQTETRIDTNLLNKGLYFVNVTSTNKTVVKKIIIK
ncbi:T9SS type A sorting domain-containing protein [Algibacter sp. 2305UL17-15]|uniref:T9SS type A sorting domain-containing protein n=1 Tax=Algibacter sp. 2305UL17-15 TaxID=3231268 RepID=UPI003458007F